MFKQLNEEIPTGSKRVVEIQVKLVLEGAVGDVNITDLMLQGGRISTKWVSHPSEIRWAVDG